MAWIDIAKGIGILAVLIGHNIGSLRLISYSFHMPLFFILAGYTLKPVKYGDIPKATLKDLKRLIIPCLIARGLILLWNCIFKNALFSNQLRILCVTMLWGNHRNSFIITKLPRVGRIWFLIALFWGKLVYRLLLNIFEDRDRIPFLLIAGFASMFLGSYGIELPQNFDMLFACILFIEIGHTMKSWDIFTKIDHWVLILIFAMWSYLCFNQQITISFNERYYPGYGLCIVVALAGCICIFFFSKSIEKKIIGKPLAFFGKNSLVLLIIHTVAPYVYSASSNKQKLLDMVIECLLVIVFVYAKTLLMKLRHIHS